MSPTCERRAATGAPLLPYWLMFTLWAVGAIQVERRLAQAPRLIFFVVAAAFTALMIGLRFKVGGDWLNYQRIFESIFFLDLPAALEITDPAYSALNWLAAQLGLGISFINLVCAILFTAGVARLAWRQPNPALAMLVGVPYFFIVVAMGYTRQAAAIGVVCFAIADASERHLVRLVLLIVLAAMWHKTAILILPIALVPIFRRNAVLGILGFSMFAALFALILRGASDEMVQNYVNSAYDSQGAFIRVSMNVVASLIFIALRKRIEMNTFQKSFWISCALISFVSVGGLFVASASSGIDRLSLYIIPIQMIAYSRLPDITNKRQTFSPMIFFCVIVYCAAVQFVWLNFATNAGYWVPYQFAL